MHRFTSLLATVAIATFATSVQAQTDAEFAQAKAEYTLEDLQGDALCGEASLMWVGASGAIHKGFVKDRQTLTVPGGYHIFPAAQDVRIHGMPLAGLIEGGNGYSVALVFKLPPKEVFSKLPGKPVMKEVRRFKEGALEMSEWEQVKDRPNLMAVTWGEFTSVNCRRKSMFIATPRKKK